ncbi:MAG: hypothetical protein ACI9SC_002998, partial [Gammaproteobacteria bacterium]
YIVSRGRQLIFTGKIHIDILKSGFGLFFTHHNKNRHHYQTLTAFLNISWF